MEYIERHLTSDPGMDQREALTALQSHPSFKTGSIVASIRNRNGQWVADVLEPKTAAEDEAPDSEGGDETPPKKEAPPAGPPSDGGGGDEGGAPDGPPSPDGGDKPPAEKGDKPEGKGGTEEAMLHVMTQILHALTGGGAPDVAGGPDALGPGGPPGGPPAPHGAGPAGPPPPKGPAGPPGAGAPPMGKGPMPRAMKPGDTPPGGTPVGAPAFASTHEANGVLPAQGTPVPQGAEAGPMGQQATAGVCPQDGNPEPCPIHAPAAQGLGGAVAAMSARAATISLSRPGSDISQAVAEARPVVENFGYQVKQAKRSDDGTQVHILASRRR